jgi:alkyl sulfatase BDS1-like metallo-beta-lactamase superfamily hydrolase
MGGADAVLAKAREAYARGDYRWVAQIGNDLVFADPSNAAARALQADALEQLGYQSENATWRNIYLTGAQELRDGVPKLQGSSPARPISCAR